MNARNTASTFLIRMLVLIVILSAGTLPAIAQTGANKTPAGTPGSSVDSNQGTAGTTETNYLKRNNWAKEFHEADRVNERGESESGQGSTLQTKGPLYIWPEKHQTQSIQADLPSRRDQAIAKFQVKTFGLPVSDTQYQIISRLNDNMLLEEAFDPERWMWMETAMGAVKATSAANSAANLARNQSQGAIEFAQNFLPNFTADAGNVWNRIRNELFVPMAILLLLPGAVLSQVRAIVAQGTGVLGDVNPFDGILRSIVAIFLIPATYLVVNYGIDVSNAISHEINNGYSRVFGGNMYDDAACGQRRAFPIRNPNQNKNAIPTTDSTANQTPPAGTENNPRAQLEAASFDIGASENCGQSQGQQNQTNQAQQGGGGPQDFRANRFKTQGDSFGNLVNSLTGQGGGGGVNVNGQVGTGGVGVNVNGQVGTGGVGVNVNGQIGTGGVGVNVTAGLQGTQQGANTASQGVQQGLGGQQGQQAQQDDGKADEEVPVLVSTQRLLLNVANAGLASTWNILCAFQMAYLYYLFCIGPVVAALWVWPMGQLRSALPSWVEGVVTLCFWSLFWNTTILIMAAFKNVDQTGTLVMTALNFLATASVKNAFDFAALVKDAGAQVAKEAEKAGKGGGGRGGGGGGKSSTDQARGQDTGGSKDSKGTGTKSTDPTAPTTPSTPGTPATPSPSPSMGANAPASTSLMDSMTSAMSGIANAASGAYNAVDGALGGILPGGVDAGGSGAAASPPPLATGTTAVQPGNTSSPPGDSSPGGSGGTSAPGSPGGGGDKSANVNVNLPALGAGLGGVADAMGLGPAVGAVGEVISAAGGMFGITGSGTATPTGTIGGSDATSSITPGTGNTGAPGTGVQSPAVSGNVTQGSGTTAGTGGAGAASWLESGYKAASKIAGEFLDLGGPPMANLPSSVPLTAEALPKASTPQGSNTAPTDVPLPPKQPVVDTTITTPQLDPGGTQTPVIPPVAAQPLTAPVQTPSPVAAPQILPAPVQSVSTTTPAYPSPSDSSAFYPTPIQVQPVAFAPAGGYAAPSHIPAPTPAPEQRHVDTPSAPVNPAPAAPEPSYFSPGARFGDGSAAAQPGQFSPGTRLGAGSPLAKALGRAAPKSLQEELQSASAKSRASLKKQQGTMTGRWGGPTKPQGGA